MSLSTPVAFFIFNRPDTTQRVFAEIAKAKPKQLFIVADGPRKDRQGEAELCQQARKIVEGVDWPCEIQQNYSDENLGCGKRVSSGISWVFEQVPEAIFLEDDCLPSKSFFPFCKELLQYYRENENVMAVCGTNVLGRWKEKTQSYHFSRFGGVWGWASWRRAWQHYDFKMTSWSDIENQKKIEILLKKTGTFDYWSNAFTATYEGKIDTWDYQWTYTFLLRGFVAVPSLNLVSNIGFRPDASHTKDINSIHANRIAYELAFPLPKDSEISPDKAYDKAFHNLLFEKKSIPTRIQRKVKSLIRKQ